MSSRFKVRLQRRAVVTSQTHDPHEFWQQGSTGVERYGCIPRSAANNLGEIPQKMGAPNPLL